MNRLTCIVVAGFILMAAIAHGAGNSAQHQNTGKGRLAIKGYDPVSYFNGGPREGKEQFTAEYDGAVYRFESDENRKAFVENATKYAPAYGGWCATAMSYDKKVEVDVKNYKITDGRLFLFYKDFFSDAQKKWVKDEANLTKKADANWKRIVGE